MTDTTESATKTPGIVIFVAILNFLTTAVFFLLAAISVMGLLFGNIFGIYEYMTQRLSQYSHANPSVGLSLLFIIFLAVSVTFLFCFLFLGIGLLKGRRLAWYFQIALSVLGLLSFPVGTLVNAVILVLFFQAPTRDYFKV